MKIHGAIIIKKMKGKILPNTVTLYDEGVSHYYVGGN